ncbi:MAG: GtrA family protein [Coprobacillaceae bacterium]
MKEKCKEWFKYGCNGVLTTLVNYSIFFIISTFGIHYLISNTIAWLAAVIFAYYTNRKWVFKSQGSFKEEFLSFISLRFVTLIIENISLYLCIQIFGITTIISKCAVSIITIIANYAICKTKIFNKGGIIHGQN